MADGFKVDPGELDAFAAHVNDLVTDLGETQSKIASTNLSPLVYGLIGQLFAIGVAIDLGKTAGELGKYRDTLSSLYNSVKQEARNYEFTDEANAEILKKQLP
jgi:Excreted virulence factor EspC, type VII ESX diderm